MQQAGGYPQAMPPPRSNSLTSEEGRRQGGCCPRTRKRFFDEQQCTTAPCQWAVVALLWLVQMCTSFYSDHDIFGPLLFSSPLVIVLALSLCSSTCGVPGPPNWKKLSIFAVFMFLIYWTVYKSYGAQCRSAWAMVMLSDENFTSNATVTEEMIHEYWKDDFATIEDDQIDANIDELLKATTAAGAKLAQAAHMPNAPTGAVIADASNGSAGSEAPEHETGSWKHSSKKVFELIRDHWGLATKDGDGETSPSTSERLADGQAAVKAAVREAGEEWFEPWSNGESLSNMLLRAYCLHHQRDPAMPHVYPLMKFGIGGHDMNFKLPCTFSTCVLTESRRWGTDRLVYIWVLLGMGILQWLHSTFAGLPNSAWWPWLWACVLPLWSVALAQSMDELASFELPELVGYLITSARDMIVDPFSGAWDTPDGDIKERDTEHIVFVALLVVAVIGLHFRQRILTEFLGLHDWLPRFSLLGGSDRHEFQVSVWKVEPAVASAAPVQDGGGGLADGGGGATSWGGWLLGGLSGPGMFTASPRPVRRGALPHELTVHLIYAGDELQRSQKTRRAEDGLTVSDVHYVRECFKLSLEQGHSNDFIIEMRGRMGGDFFRSVVVIGPEQLERAFKRSGDAHSQQIDVEQFRAMKNPRIDEGMMKSLGFQGYQGTNGGEVWLAFCDYSC